MKKNRLLSLLLVLGITSQAQTISPTESTPICPHFNFQSAQQTDVGVVRFEIDFGSNAANGYEIITGTGVTNTTKNCKVVTNIAPLNNDPASKIGVCYVAFEDQRAATPEFTTKKISDGSTKTFKFPFIRSIKGLKPTLQFLNPLNLPLCNTGNIPYSFTTLVRYKKTDDQTEFEGAIPLYEYSVPKGWKVGSDISTGQNNFILAVPGATITYDEIHSGEIKIRATQRNYLCGGINPPAAGDWAIIPFTRPTLRLIVNGNTSLQLPCGSSTPQTFTVENGNQANCLSYVWNLGSNNNNWLFNGSPAQQFITTSTNSITLTPAPCSGPPSSVSVTIRINNVDIDTYTVPVTTIEPTLSIEGSDGNTDLTCDNENYTINGLPCGATVAWQISDPTKASLTVTGNTATVTRIANGPQALFASITGSCITNQVDLHRNIYVGVPSSQDIGIKLRFADPDHLQCFTVYTALRDGNAFSATNYEWAINPEWHIITATDGPTVNFVPDGDFSNGYLTLKAMNACGWSDEQLLFMHVDPCVSPFRVATDSKLTDVAQKTNTFNVYPNPAQSYINITGTTVNSIIKIYDAKGALVKSYRPTATNVTKLNVNGLKAGVYFVEMFNGKERQRKAIIIQ